MLYLKEGKLVHETLIRVTYKDTDKMGYSYYGNYPTYMEIGRTEFLRELGLTYRKLEDDGYLLPIAQMNIKYIKPALYDDIIKVKTIFKGLHNIKVEFDYEIYNPNNELITEAYTLLIFADSNKRKPTKAPQYYLDCLNKFLIKK